MVLEAVYEQDFLDCSYGFRPGRSAHQALQALWRQAMTMAGGWVLEVDIRKFFDTLDHGHLRELLRRRVLDGVLLRLIGKWLNAGVLEDGGITYPDAGSPQGGVVSPILANIYLHEVLDTWFEREVKPRLSGKRSARPLCGRRGALLRARAGCAQGHGRAAEAIREVRPDPASGEDAARRIPPTRPTAAAFGRRRDGHGPGPSTCWASPTSGASPAPASGSSDARRPKTASDGRSGASRTGVASTGTTTCATQQRALAQKLNGHYGYFGIIGNFVALQRFLYGVRRTWRKWLNRRSQRARMNGSG